MMPEHMDPHVPSQEDLLIRSITTLLHLLQPPVSAPPAEDESYHAFRQLLDRITLLFVREAAAGEAYAVSISHSLGHTLLYLCPNAPRSEPKSPTHQPFHFDSQWLENILHRGGLSTAEHAACLEHLVNRLNAKSPETVTELLHYVYFFSCRKLKKRLEKMLRGKSFVAALAAIDSKAAAATISSYFPAVEPRLIRNDEAWMQQYAEYGLGLKLKFKQLRLPDRVVKHVDLSDAASIAVVVGMAHAIVDCVHTHISRICEFSKARVPEEQVAGFAKEIHECLRRIQSLAEILRLMVNSLSLRRILRVVPDGSDILKWLLKISQWEMAICELAGPAAHRHLQTLPLRIFVLQPPTLSHPKSMAPLDATISAVFGPDPRIVHNAKKYLATLARNDSPYARNNNRRLWRCILDWANGWKADGFWWERPAWEAAFLGTVHCEATTATVRFAGMGVHPASSRDQVVEKMAVRPPFITLPC